jgi:hypothetical protein
MQYARQTREHPQPNVGIEDAPQRHKHPEKKEFLGIRARLDKGRFSKLPAPSLGKTRSNQTDHLHDALRIRPLPSKLSHLFHRQSAQQWFCAKQDN